MANKRYYWLRLKDDFFTDKRIKKLRKIAGGDTYTIIYLKMQLLSLQDEGVLYFEHIEDTFPEEIALQIDEDVEDVKIAISFLLNCGLLIPLDEESFELVETKKCIGSETQVAERVRNHRARKELEKIEQQKALLCNTDVTKCNIEKEKEKDIEIDKKKYKRKNKSVFSPPTLEEIENYVKEKSLNVNAKQFYDYFSEGNWIDAKGNKVKSWKQKILTWNSYSKPKIKEETEEEEFARKLKGLEDALNE